MTPLLKFVWLWQSVKVFAYPFVLFHLTDGYQITSEEQASLQMRLQNSLKIQVGNGWKACIVTVEFLENPGRKVYKKPALWLSLEFHENPGRKVYKKPALWLSLEFHENPGRKVYKKPALWLSLEFHENPGRKVYKKPALWLSIEFLENPARKVQKACILTVSRIPWKSR